jgi:hypothetical protein
VLGFLLIEPLVRLDGLSCADTCADIGRFATGGRFPRSAIFVVFEGLSVERPCAANLVRTAEVARTTEVARTAEVARRVPPVRAERFVPCVGRTETTFFGVDGPLNREIGRFSGDDGRFDVAEGFCLEVRLEELLLTSAPLALCF